MKSCHEFNAAVAILCCRARRVQGDTLCATAVQTKHQKEADGVCMQMVAAAPASRDMPGKPAQGQRPTREAAQKPARHLRGGSAAAQEGRTQTKTARSQDLPRQQPSAAAELEQESPRPSSLPTKGHKVLTHSGLLCLHGIPCRHLVISQ